MTNSVVPLVSIVTPFYNTAAYLAECIRSVLSQSYQNWEYVLVNNCSTDGSLEIAQKYAVRDSRIRLSTNETFLGQVQNYNHALRQVSPRAAYIKMVQADDWLFPDCVRQMTELAETDDEIAIVSAYSMRHNFIGCQGLPFPSAIVSGRTALRLHLMEGQTVVGTPTNVLYRADLVREREKFFDEKSMLEDLEICYELLMEHKLGFIHQVLTYVRENNESISVGLMAFNPWPLHRLILIRKYGRQLLSDQEYRNCFKSVAESYLNYLGYMKLRGRSAEFWEYQKQGFSDAGMHLSQWLLWRRAAGALLDIVGNPKQTWDRFTERRRRLRAPKGSRVSNG